MSNHQILNSADHADLRVRTEAGAAYGDAVMAALVVPDEFRKVQAHYPIVFRREADGGRFSALALFGFENGENLFLDGDRWDARYRPLSMAIQPFLVGRPAQEGGEAQIHIDMDHPRIATDGEGTRVFDEHGRATPFIEAIGDRLGDLHEGYQTSGAFFDALARHGLLEPFSFEVTQPDGGKNTLVGFHMINENALEALDGEALADLHCAGHLLPVFMAVASLSRLTDLVDRRTARAARG